MKVMPRLPVLFGALLLASALIPLVFFSIRNVGIIILTLAGVFFCLLPQIWAQLAAPRWSPLQYPFIIVTAAVFLMITSLSVWMIQKAWFNRPTEDNGILIVLGAKVKDDQPSKMLAKRLRIASNYLQEHPEAICVVSGGQGADESYPEAVVMKAYLTGLGIDPQRIYLEDSSSNTEENIRNSLALVREIGPELPVTIVTDDFHQLRASIYAEAHGVSVTALSCMPPPGLIPCYWAREYCAVAVSLLKITFL